MALVNADDLDWVDVDDGEMHVRRKQLGEAAGSDRLGCSLYELPAGEASWPYHYHTANEEALYVIAGTGMLRLDGETQPLRAGDFVALPADESGGHKVVNDSEEALRYLAVSTMNEPDITVYPDSGKIGVYAGAPPGGRDGGRLGGRRDPLRRRPVGERRSAVTEPSGADGTYRTRADFGTYRVTVAANGVECEATREVGTPTGETAWTVRL